MCVIVKTLNSTIGRLYINAQAGFPSFLYGEEAMSSTGAPFSLRQALALVRKETRKYYALRNGLLLSICGYVVISRKAFSN